MRLFSSYFHSGQSSGQKPGRRGTHLPPRTGFAFLWIALIPVLLTVAAVALNRQFRSEVGWVRHTYDVGSAIRDTAISVSSADRNLRNYALTGEEQYLRATRTDAAHARDYLRELQGLIVDNPAQQRNLARMQPVLEDMLADQQRTL